MSGTGKAIFTKNTSRHNIGDQVNLFNKNGNINKNAQRYIDSGIAKVGGGYVETQDGDYVEAGDSIALTINFVKDYTQIFYDTAYSKSAKPDETEVFTFSKTIFINEDDDEGDIEEAEGALLEEAEEEFLNEVGGIDSSGVAEINYGASDYDMEQVGEIAESSEEEIDSDMEAVSFIDSSFSGEVDSSGRCVYNALEEKFKDSKGIIRKIVSNPKLLNIVLNYQLIDRYGKPDKKRVKRLAFLFNKYNENKNEIAELLGKEEVVDTGAIYSEEDIVVEPLNRLLFDSEESEDYLKDLDADKVEWGVSTRKLLYFAKLFDKKLIAKAFDGKYIACYYPEKIDKNGDHTIYYTLKHKHIYMEQDSEKCKSWSAVLNSKKKRTEDIIVEDKDEPEWKTTYKYYSEDSFRITDKIPKDAHNEELIYIVRENILDEITRIFKEDGILLTEKPFVCGSEISSIVKDGITFYKGEEDFLERLGNINTANIEIKNRRFVLEVELEYLKSKYPKIADSPVKVRQRIGELDRKIVSLSYLNWKSALGGLSSISYNLFRSLSGISETSSFGTKEWDYWKELEPSPYYSSVGISDCKEKRKVGKIDIIKRHFHSVSVKDKNCIDNTKIEELSGGKYFESKIEVKTDKYEVEYSDINYVDIDGAYYHSATDLNRYDFCVFDELCEWNKGRPSCLQDSYSKDFVADIPNYLYYIHSKTLDSFMFKQQIEDLIKLGYLDSRCFEIRGYMIPVGYIPKNAFIETFDFIKKKFINPKPYINQLIGTFGRRETTSKSVWFNQNPQEFANRIYENKESDYKYTIHQLKENTDKGKTSLGISALFRTYSQEVKRTNCPIRSQIVGNGVALVLELKEAVKEAGLEVKRCVCDSVEFRNPEGKSLDTIFNKIRFDISLKDSGTKIYPLTTETGFNNFYRCERNFKSLWSNKKVKRLTERKIEFNGTLGLFDFGFMVNKILAGEGFQILGEAGRGKTFIAKKLKSVLEAQGIKTEALAFTNKATNNLGGKTIHKKLVLKVGDQDFATNIKSRIIQKIKAEGIAVIFLDEVSMISRKCWNAIKIVARELPDIVWVGIGDFGQIEPVEKLICGSDYENSSAVLDLFNRTTFTLTINRRSGEDAIAMEKVVKDNRDGNIYLSHFKYKGRFSDIKRHLAYYHIRVRAINDALQNRYCKGSERLEVQDKKNDLQSYFGLKKGLPLISNKNKTIDKELIWSKNQDFILDSSEKDFISVIHKESDIVYKIKRDAFEYEFSVAYCITYHRSQGDTIRERYMIHDWLELEGKKYISSKSLEKLRYVVLTRTTARKDIFIYSK